MPTQKEIKSMARKRGLSIEEMSKQVFGHMRSQGWRPKAQGGPTKKWGSHKG